MSGYAGSHVVFDNDPGEPAELDEDILFDVPDDALERAAATTADGRVLHSVVHCGWPL